MTAYRLRIELPDRPGALAGVTGALAASGANIVSIDVHEVDGATAVDEITVEVGDGWMPGPLAAALAQRGDGSLLASRRLASTEEPLTAALHAVAAMVAGDVEDGAAAAIAGLAGGSEARLLDVADAEREPAGRKALDRRSSIVSHEDETWVLAALDDTTDPHTVAIVTRPAEVRFSATEVSRVEALLRIRRRLLIDRATLSP